MSDANKTIQPLEWSADGTIMLGFNELTILLNYSLMASPYTSQSIL